MTGDVMHVTRRELNDIDAHRVWAHMDVLTSSERVLTARVGSESIEKARDAATTSLVEAITDPAIRDSAGEVLAQRYQLLLSGQKRVAADRLFVLVTTIHEGETGGVMPRGFLEFVSAIARDNGDTDTSEYVDAIIEETPDDSPSQTELLAQEFEDRLEQLTEQALKILEQKTQGALAILQARSATSGIHRKEEYRLGDFWDECDQLLIQLQIPDIRTKEGVDAVSYRQDVVRLQRRAGDLEKLAIDLKNGWLLTDEGKNVVYGRQDLARLKRLAGTPDEMLKDIRSNPPLFITPAGLRAAMYRQDEARLRLYDGPVGYMNLYEALRTSMFLSSEGRIDAKELQDKLRLAAHRKERNRVDLNDDLFNGRFLTDDAKDAAQQLLETL